MSTTIKRIALVAVAALTLGVVSVAPSQAAVNALIKYKSGDGAAAGDLNTGTGVAGAFNYVTVTAETWSSTAGNDYVITTDSSILAGSGTIASDKKSLLGTAGANDIQIATPAVGTVTVSYWKRTAGVLAATAAETVVITVNATKQSGTYSAANSTVFIVAGETNSALSATADATVTGLGTANIETATATIGITLKDALKAAIDDTVTATVISGGANVRLASRAESVTAIAVGESVTAGVFSASKLTTSGQALVFVHANGTSGPTIIRLTNSAGTELAQKTVTFSSTTVATLAATVVYGNINGTKTGAVTVIAKDSAGYVVPNAPVSVTSSDTTKIASGTCLNTDSTGKAVCDVVATASASGASTLTFKSGVATTTASVRAAGVVATKLTITASATSAEAGSKVTYTIDVADANGALADGDYINEFFAADPVTSNGGTGAFAADTVTVLAGKATSEIFVPFIAGKYSTTWTLKGTAGTATTNLDKALAGTKVTVDVDVTNASADAALDAANEAATAAQDATDAAIQAADAADEATAAVAALSLEVNTLIAGLKKQLVTLTNLVKNLQKAVAAKK
jgi:trimeric autotransporter adhesin